MSKNHKMLRLLATTSIIATNVFPVTPQLPQIVVQAASLQEEQEPSATEENSTSSDHSKEEISTSQSAETTSSSEEQLVQESDAKDSKNQEADSSKETSASVLGTITGKWGTADYIFNSGAGVLEVHADSLDMLNEEPPWKTPWKTTGAIPAEDIQYISFMGSNKFGLPRNCRLLFAGLVNLKRIDGMEKLQTDLVTSMYSMFYNCSSLQSLDLSSWNTSKVTDMYGMFRDCS
ncbi:BspA family leucine-rich repeat surface protein, partial [Enterococcus sp. 3G1_DIV0629]|uniref:BspA family leucine-rich repeat surface protein n=1 Tax=Enterococcus sp. (strain 3G1_DIV0629) TaxID=1834176 RepID=UPI001177D311